MSPVIGPILSAIAAGTSCLVARREPRHWPICGALGTSALHAIATRLEAWLAPNDPSPRAALLLWTLVAVASGWAYLRAWQWNRADALFLVVSSGSCWFAAQSGTVSWALGTWFPFVASSIVGGVSLWSWLSRSLKWQWLPTLVDSPYRGAWAYPEWTFTQRIALILLVSDVCMLLFVAIGSEVAQKWQGRASAAVVTLLQVGWWIGARYAEQRNLILALLKGRDVTSGRWLVEHSGGKLSRGTVYVILNKMEDEGLVESRLAGNGRRIYRSMFEE